MPSQNTLSTQEKHDLAAKFQLIIQEAMIANDQSKIQRMTQKMKRMGLDIRDVEEMLREHERQQSRTKDDSNGASSGTSSGARKRRRDSTSAPQRNAPQDDEQDDPSIPKDENYMLVERIMKIEDYYKILQVEKSATIAQTVLKRKYRKLAMKLHPDSNRHKKATEAFQKVQKAYATLSDEDKKRLYDEYGTDDRSEIAQRQQQQWTRQMRGGRMGGASPFGNGFMFSTAGGPGGVDLGEEILRQFFGGPMFNMHAGGARQRRRNPFDFFEDDEEENHHQQQRRQQHRQQQQQRAQEKTPLTALLSLLPFLLIFLLPLILNLQSVLPSSRSSYSNRAQQYFSFQKTADFIIPRETYQSARFGKVKYFVTKPFHDQYSANYQVMRQIDDSVFSQYREFLRKRCASEKKRQINLIASARKHDRGSEQRRKMMTKAQTMSMKSCTILLEKYREEVGPEYLSN